MRVASWSAGAAVLLALVLGVWIWRSVQRPIAGLHSAAQRLGEGRLDTRVDVDAGGELGELARACNHMAAALAANTVSLGNLEAVLDSAPDVFAHNLETVPRLYPGVRPRSSYERSLDVLARAVAHPKIKVVKAGIMVGLGEEIEELRSLLRDVHAIGVHIVTIGQYLQPSVKHHRVERFYAPGEFDDLAAYGHSIGLPHVESGPLVRSSYHAAEQSAALR